MTGESDATDIADATTVLLLAPNVEGRSVDACVRALARVDEELDRAVAVTVGSSAADWLSRWGEGPMAATPVTCVDVDDVTRSAATESRARSGDAANAAVETVADPADLESLGRRISDVLQRADESGETAAVAVHSLTGILGHVDERVAFKFVYTLGEVVRRIDGTVVFHLDPDAHDAETVETFRIGCDEVVEFGRGSDRKRNRET
ncbi:MAG: hypothetical protein ABEJ26_07140 [Halosimplex sp.]